MTEGYASVLFVDGCSKGHTRYVDRKAHLWVVVKPPDLKLQEVHDPVELLPLLDQEVYYFHDISFFGIIIRIASICATFVNINPGDLYDTVLSPEVKRTILAAAEIPVREGSGHNPV